MLLKYVPHAYFLQNNLWRFTQPSDLNDPLEARPSLQMNAYSEEDYAEARRQTKSYFGIHTPTLEQLEDLMGPYPAGRFDEKSFPGLWPMVEKRLREKPFSSIAEFDESISWRTIELCLRYADKNLGIFSLSKNRSDLLWAYYANADHGLCIEFDAGHEFFSAARSIDYNKIPFYVTNIAGEIRLAGRSLKIEDVLDERVGDAPQELFYRKHVDWQHEQEWRLILPLSHSDELIRCPSGDLPKHLFRIPSSAIRSITLGYRSSALNAQNVIEYVSKRENSHISVFKRYRDKAGQVKSSSVL